MKTYFAHGKLLLSAEYAILHGAKGIALPLNKGQRLEFNKTSKKESKSIIKWTAFDENNYPWFEASFDRSDKSIINCTYKGAAQTMQKLFKLVPIQFFEEDCDYRFETYLEFNKAWGWGTSSTLVSLLSQCTGANPYKLYRATFKGSGFDLACATAKGPILYGLNESNQPLIETFIFEPAFKDQIHFVYLGKKQNSLKSISKRNKPDPNFIEQINRITHELGSVQNDIEQFKTCLYEHEKLLSRYLEMPTIKEQLFSDTNLTIKSLGAWGGDFVMMIGDKAEIEALKKKGYDTTFSWDDIIL